MGYTVKIPCVSYRMGKCLHQAAPRSFFGAAQCILEHPGSDPRVPNKCELQIIPPRPKPSPRPPGPGLRK